MTSQSVLWSAFDHRSNTWLQCHGFPEWNYCRLTRQGLESLECFAAFPFTLKLNLGGAPRVHNSSLLGAASLLFLCLYALAPRSEARTDHQANRVENQPPRLILRTAITSPQHFQTYHTGIDSPCLGRTPPLSWCLAPHALSSAQAGGARTRGGAAMEQTCLAALRRL